MVYELRGPQVFLSSWACCVNERMERKHGHRPRVAFAEELRATEQALRTAVRRYELDHVRENGENSEHPARRAQKPLSRHRRDQAHQRDGAGEMVRLAAQRLPFSLSRYAPISHEVADRLGQGRREHADLVWLRAMRAALKGGACGEQGLKAAPLLGMAIAGAARPVVVFRSFGEPPPDSIAHLPH